MNHVQIQILLMVLKIDKKNEELIWNQIVKIVFNEAFKSYHFLKHRLE